MKKFLIVMLLGLSTIVLANQPAQYLKASYGRCEGRLNGKKYTFQPRESLCVLGGPVSACFTKTGKSLTRTYKGAKIKGWKNYVVLDDSVSKFFFQIHKTQRNAFITSKILVKGNEAKSLCVGRYRFIPFSYFKDEMNKWVRNSRK